MAKNGKRRSGFLFVLFIFILLGIIIFAYRDKFAVFFNTSFNSGREFFSKKMDSGKKSAKDNQLIKIDLFGNKNNNRQTDNAKNENLQKQVEELKETIIELKDRLEDNTGKDNSVKSGNNESQTELKIINQKQAANDSEINKKTANSGQPLKPEKSNENIHVKTANIYFSRISGDDKLNLAVVKRDVKYTDSPLTETLKLLLNGPNNQEKSKEIITNIPKNTRLLSVYIKDGIAFINLSRDFELNPFGKDATIAQLKQIVYTTTEFTNVKAVQFLIEGRVKTYLGGEGIIINKPISRNDFS